MKECTELKAKTEKLVRLLDKAFSLVLKCRANSIMKRVFTIIPAAAFHKMSAQLENSISDVSWLLRVSAPAEDRGDAGYLGLPPIAATSPSSASSGSIFLFSTPDPLKTASVLPLPSFLLHNDCYTKIIIEEGGLIYPFQSASKRFLLSRGLGVRCSVLLDGDTSITDSFSSHWNFFTPTKQVKRIEISDRHREDR
ncbi:Uncharacterized protein Rs2_27136 [Raphanus sativus]|nr:Uncharacterized protein Rs2_27136 [Raphanus sativus]